MCIVALALLCEVLCTNVYTQVYLYGYLYISACMYICTSYLVPYGEVTPYCTLYMYKVCTSSNMLVYCVPVRRVVYCTAPEKEKRGEEEERVSTVCVRAARASSRECDARCGLWSGAHYIRGEKGGTQCTLPVCTRTSAIVEGGERRERSRDQSGRVDTALYTRSSTLCTVYIVLGAILCTSTTCVHRTYVLCTYRVCTKVLCTSTVQGTSYGYIVPVHCTQYIVQVRVNSSASTTSVRARGACAARAYIYLYVRACVYVRVRGACVRAVVKCEMHRCEKRGERERYL